ncbi:MAG: GIY-YIG nuclease family protein, partial [Akkermansiaceae bacterium]
MVSQELKAKLRDVPHQPGVYIMKDRLGSIIYVGKAIDLKRRVSSYFVPSGKNRASLKTRALLDSVHEFECLIVRNDEVALIREGKLLKEYRP